ncbi:Uncharacterized protein Rs2_07661 [Raphanus sativus]|nr:Uncharacterized protein Rs2_07661 [Raphanus sativus]
MTKITPNQKTIARQSPSSISSRRTIRRRLYPVTGRFAVVISSRLSIVVRPRLLRDVLKLLISSGRRRQGVEPSPRSRRPRASGCASRRIRRRCRDGGRCDRAATSSGGDFVDFEILYECEKLEDQRLINDICRNGDSVLHLIVKRSAKVRAKPVDKSFELSIVAPPQARVVTQRKQFSVEPLIVNPKVKLSPVVKDMISSASDGLRSENPLVRSREGTGGAYFMQASSGNK